MITIFSIPKPFLGHIGMIQRNAIASWTRLPGCEVVLFGEEEGMEAAAAELGVEHVKEVSRNEAGTPLLSDVFDRARQRSSLPLVAYVNADIILTQSFLAAARAARAGTSREFLMVGQRWDLDVPTGVRLDGDWEAELRERVHKSGKLHGKAGIDYFVFPKEFSVMLPPFAVGRPGWDSWMIYRTRTLGIPLIDATAEAFVVHQNHPPAYKSFGSEARRNAELAGGVFNMGTIRNANMRITGGRLCSYPFAESVKRALLFSPPVRLLLGAKRTLQAYFGEK